MNQCVSPRPLTLPDSSTLEAQTRSDASIERAFSLAAFIMNRHMVDHFVRTSRQLGLDFEALVILAVVAHQNAAHLMPPGSVPSAVLDDSGRLPQAAVMGLRPLRLRDVTQITGIPRETVRRKLRMLGDAGWLTETEAGWVVNRDSIGPEVRELTRESVRRFMATASDLSNALRDAERLLGQ